MEKEELEQQNNQMLNSTFNEFGEIIRKDGVNDKDNNIVYPTFQPPQFDELEQYQSEQSDYLNDKPKSR